MYHTKLPNELTDSLLFLDDKAKERSLNNSGGTHCGLMHNGQIYLSQPGTFSSVAFLCQKDY